MTQGQKSRFRGIESRVGERATHPPGVMREVQRPIFIPLWGAYWETALESTTEMHLRSPVYRTSRHMPPAAVLPASRCSREMKHPLESSSRSRSSLCQILPWSVYLSSLSKTSSWVVQRGHHHRSALPHVMLQRPSRPPSCVCALLSSAFSPASTSPAHRMFPQIRMLLSTVARYTRAVNLVGSSLGTRESASIPHGQRSTTRPWVHHELASGGTRHTSHLPLHLQSIPLLIEELWIRVSAGHVA